MGHFPCLMLLPVLTLLEYRNTTVMLSKNSRVYGNKIVAVRRRINDQVRGNFKCRKKE